MHDASVTLVEEVHCRDVLAKIIAQDSSSDQQIARVRILKYLDLQLSRAEVGLRKMLT